MPKLMKFLIIFNFINSVTNIFHLCMFLLQKRAILSY